MIFEHRDHNSIGEWLALILLRPVSFIFPTWITVPVETLAKAMVANVWNKPGTAVEFVENNALHRLGQAFEEQFG